MKTQNTRNNHQSPVVSEKDVFNLLGQAKHLEFCRQVDKAMDVLRPVWGDINKPPAADGYSPTVRGEILLRCGSLLSYYSHYKQFEGQEMSRDRGGQDFQRGRNYRQSRRSGNRAGDDLLARRQIQ